LSGGAYVYPGDDAELAAATPMFTSRIGDGRGNHEEDFLSALRLAAAGKAGGAFLDVGSGVGRIVDLVRAEAGRVTGLEPDAERCRACETGFAHDPRVAMFRMTTTDYRVRFPRRRFDLVTVSMVLQHVSTGTCARILGDVRAMMAPGALAVIATTHFFEERFTFEADASAHDAAEFDRCADGEPRPDKGLPVRMFSQASLAQEIARAGLEPIVWRPFTFVRPESLERAAAQYRAPPERLRDVGLSQYVVARAAGRPRGFRSWRARAAGLLPRG
jgi:SAM-dependent methyltransferase